MVLSFLEKHKWTLPTWYLIGVFIFDIVTFSIFYIARSLKNFFTAGILDIINIFLLIIWFIINLRMILVLFKIKSEYVNYIFPVYFSIMDSYILITYHLAWFKNIYLSVEFAKFLSFVSTAFELSFATLFLYMKYYQSKKIISYGKITKTKQRTSKNKISKKKSAKPKNFKKKLIAKKSKNFPKKKISKIRK